MLILFLASVALTTGVFRSENGMRHDMREHDAAPCVDTECEAAPASHDATPADCIAHCLKASAPITTETTPTIVVLSLAFAVAIAAARRLALALTSHGATDAIAALVRKRAIATVVLRN